MTILENLISRQKRWTNLFYLKRWIKNKPRRWKYNWIGLIEKKIRVSMKPKKKKTRYNDNHIKSSSKSLMLIIL